MTFEALHKVVLYATVLFGLLPIALSGEIPIAFIVAAYGGVAASWFYEAPRRRVDSQVRWWNLAIVGSFAVLAAFGYTTGNYILYAIIFALIMVVTRLYQSRGSRDVFQLYGLTFVAMVAGAVINPTLSFVFIFVGYVVLLVWGLILLHLQRDIEDLVEERELLGERGGDLSWQARHLITPRFLLGSSVLALFIFASSLMIFFFFPRLGMGFFFSQGRNQQQVSGFADRIQLGHFGTIKDNHRVVMRLEFDDDRELASRAVRLRGISFNHYDGRVWSKTLGHDTFQMPRQDLGTWVAVHDATRFANLPGETVAQTIYLEPLDMDQRMIFGLPMIQKLSIDNPQLDRLRRHPVRFYQDLNRDISTRVPGDVALRYHVESFVPVRAARLLRVAAGDRPPEVDAAYLQLPDRLDPAVAELARTITEGADNDFDRADAIERHLRANYDYSTEGGHDPKAPLEDFLFRRRQGHCEYFASAMVVLLRSLGVPARPANGFYGGVYNEYGRFYMMRQADAHSWVEVFFPGYGWTTFDPTPPGAVLVPAQSGLVGAFDEWIDSLRLQWYKWVVEYDLEKQMAFFRSIGDAMGGIKDYFPQPQGNPRRAKAWREGFKEWLNRPVTWALVGTPIALLLLWRFGVLAALLAWIRRRLRPRDVVPAGAMGALYHKMLDALRKQGVGRDPQETPRELAERLARHGYLAADEVGRITAEFERVRYAEREPTRAALDALEVDLASVKATRQPVDQVA